LPLDTWSVICCDQRTAHCPNKIKYGKHYLLKLFEYNCLRANASTLQLGPPPFLGEMALAMAMAMVMADRDSNGNGNGDGDGDSNGNG
jgi:hypothetical protein